MRAAPAPARLRPAASSVASSARRLAWRGCSNTWRCPRSHSRCRCWRRFCCLPRTGRKTADARLKPSNPASKAREHLPDIFAGHAATPGRRCRMGSIASSGVPSQRPLAATDAPLCSSAIQFDTGVTMIKSAFFVLRISIAWGLAVLLVAMLYSSLPLIGQWEFPMVLAGMATMILVVTGAISHLNRVRLIAGHIDEGALATRQRRQIEIPFEAGEAFDLLDAAIRELPRIEQVESARDSLQIQAKLTRPRSYGEPPLRRYNPLLWFGETRNQILATVTPGHDAGSVLLICEPEN